MGSEGDAKDNEADKPGSQFGPPLNDFGPPTGDFGPSVGGGDFGPPLSEFGGPQLGEVGPQWPEPPGDHPNVGWRPAAEAPPVPPTPPQYRAPETTVFPDNPPAPQARPAPAPAPDTERDVPADATVRHTAAPTGGTPERWWNSASESGEVPKPPPTTDPGLSWADDPIAKRLAPGAPVAPTGGGSGGNKRWIVLGVAAAVAVLIGLVVTIVAVNGGGDEGTTAAPPSDSSVGRGCVPSKDDRVTVGNGAGGFDSGPDAILGFQYGFYVERSGEKARRYVAPDSVNVSPAETIQAAINDQIPARTTHCLRIAQVTADTFEVDLTEYRPGSAPIVYPQVVQTVSRDGKTLILSMRARSW